MSRYETFVGSGKKKKVQRRQYEERVRQDNEYDGSDRSAFIWEIRHDQASWAFKPAGNGKEYERRITREMA